jgi:hypothetical protein
MPDIPLAGGYEPRRAIETPLVSLGGVGSELEAGRSVQH